MVVTRRNYEDDANKIKDFLQTFRDEKAEKGREATYQLMMTEIANKDAESFQVKLDDLESFDPQLAAAVEHNTRRYVSLFCEQIDELLVNYRTKNVAPQSVLDVYIFHKLKRQEEVLSSSETQTANVQKLPDDLTRNYELYFVPRDGTKHVSIRDVRSNRIGNYVCIKGVVTRVCEVKPMMRVATYTCEQCGGETYQVIKGPSFTPLQLCGSPTCKASGSKGKLHLETRGSKMIKFQEVKVQEHSDQVSVGSVPKCLSIYCYGENTRLVQPGDHVLAGGVYLPMLKTGFSQMQQGLLSETYMEAHHLFKMSKSDEKISGEELTDAEMEEISAGENAYDRLSSSIAPEIFGHDDVKKALLLLLVGGTSKHVKGMNVRGNIHICLMGDPGVAKSQLLSFVDRLALRSQYTTGRGSSGVGLTAALCKDPVTGELVLEGGALVLADQGVCCIDEFDKMPEADRTAIHEVMEQETISIAKAGITTSLNARVAILAAANPAFGRYNPRKTIEQNIQLPAALLSRFDLLFLIQDKVDRENDLRLAKHVTYVHQFCAQPPQQFKPLDMSLIRRFITMCCRQYNPVIPTDLTEYVANAYVAIRREARNAVDSTFTSPRTLLSICRVATALARLRCSDLVIKADIDEALRLMESSKESLLATHAPGGPRANPIHDAKAKIFADIKGMLNEADNANDKVLKMTDVLDTLTNRGHSKSIIDTTLTEYEELSVWLINRARTTLTFV